MSHRGHPPDGVDETGRREPERLEVLEVSQATGVFRISSTSTATYFVDLDRWTVVRVRGGGSTFLFDDEWNALVSIVSYDIETAEPEADVVRVGFRPMYTFDPGPAWPNHEWRIQRVVTSIERVSPVEAEELRARYGKRLPDQGGTESIRPPEVTTAECEECEGL